MTQFGEQLRRATERSFLRRLATDKRLRQIANRVRDGTSYEPAHEYSVRVGELMSESFEENTKTLAYMSKEVAQEVIPPVMKYGHDAVSIAAKTVQENMNAADGIAVGVPDIPFESNRIEGIVNKVSNYSDFDRAKWLFGEPMVNYTQSVVDQAVRINAQQTSKLGIEAYIVRKAEAAETRRRKKGKGTYAVPCPWCSALAGRYLYGSEPHDVYRRHEECRCKLTFERGKFRQNVWDHSETWSEDDSKKQIQAVENAIPEEKKIPDNDIVRKLGEPTYELINNHVENVPESSRSVWRKYEDKIVVSDYKAKGTAYARANFVHFNLEDDLHPKRRDQKELQTFFHESHHAIDSIAGREHFKGAMHFSSSYNNHIFPETIVSEVQELVKSRGEIVKGWIDSKDVTKLRENGIISDFNWKYTYREDINNVKYSKSMGYALLQSEVRQLPDMNRGDLSDILEGATNGKLQCGYGHGKSYWSQRTYFGVRDGLATEAFAEMSDSTFSNPESLETIKKYLPKSYSIYEEMIEFLAK